MLLVDQSLPTFGQYSVYIDETWLLLSSLVSIFISAAVNVKTNTARLSGMVFRVWDSSKLPATSVYKHPQIKLIPLAQFVKNTQHLYDKWKYHQSSRAAHEWSITSHCHVLGTTFLRRDSPCLRELPGREEHLFLISFVNIHPTFSVTGKVFFCFLAALVLSAERLWPDGLCAGRGLRCSPLCPAHPVDLWNRTRRLPVQTALLRAPQQDLCVPGCDWLYQHHWHFQTVLTHPDDSELGLRPCVLVGLFYDVETQVPGLLCGCQDVFPDGCRRSAAKGLTFLLRDGRENSTLTSWDSKRKKEKEGRENELLTITNICCSKWIFFYFFRKWKNISSGFHSVFKNSPDPKWLRDIKGRWYRGRMV